MKRYQIKNIPHMSSNENDLQMRMLELDNIYIDF